MKLKTTDTEFHALEAALNSRAAVNVPVPKEALRHLLDDHCTLLAVARGPAIKGGKGHTIEAGPDQASLR